MTDKNSRVDEMHVWGVRDSTGYWHFYYSEERADIAARFHTTIKNRISFLKAHEMHNEVRHIMFSLAPISLEKFERIIERSTESFHHRLSNSLE